MHNIDDSQMVCHICGAACASLQDLKVHVTTHSRNSSIYPCKLCGHVFSTFAARKRHKLTHLHSTDWTCELCKRKFTQHSFYIDHMLMHKLKKEMKIFICSCCGINFENEETLLEHEKMHAEEENEALLKDEDEDITVVENIKMEPSEGTQMIVMPVEEVNCNGIEEETIEEDANVSVLKDGYAIIEVAQDEEGEFICGECGKECSDIEAVNVHMKEHTQADIYECMDCKQVFKFRQSLLQHIRTVHESNRPYSCEVCWATFSSKNSLRNHRVIHLSLRYPCEECGNEFKGRSGLYLHKQRVHRGKKDFECDYCGKMFALKCQRDTHRRIHTGEKPFKCETCGAGFRAQSGLYAHRKTHTDERPYKCEICGKRLRLPYNLRLHMRTHTGEKPYACDICGRAFSQPGDCKKHKKTHRKKEERNATENVPVSVKKEEKSDFVDITYLTYDS